MKLHYKSFGQGFPIIILHGLFGSLDNWQTIAKQLAENFTVFIIDLRNHGKSPHSEEMSYALMAEDIYQFMEDNFIFETHVIGHSMGGKVAMTFADLYPDMIDKLIVVDVAPVKYKPSHIEIFNALRTANLQVESRKEVEQHLEKSITNFGTRQFLMKGLTRNKENGFRWKFNLEVLWSFYNDLIDTPNFESVFEKETLFIKGAKSNYVIDEYIKSIELIYSNYTIQTIRDAGHWVHAEQPKAFIEGVTEFLQ